MNEFDNEFFEAYKHLDRLCSDMYGCQNGVSQYITNMEQQFSNGQFVVPSWEKEYQLLKHLRWVRNRIAHDSGVYQICGKRDIQDVVRFYDSILSGDDPLTLLSKHQKARTARQRLSDSQRLSPVTSSPRSELDARDRHHLARFIKILLIMFFLCAGIYILINYF